MAKSQQIIPLSGPMNDNVDSEYLQSGKGQVSKRMNIRPDNTGEALSNTGVLGTVLLNMEVPDQGIIKTIGWCNDNENEAIIWLVYNDNGTDTPGHSIYRLFTLAGTIQKVFFEEPNLGFTADTVVNAEVIDGRLYWNDNTDQPKGFNINKAVNYTAGLTEDAYLEADTPFNEKIFPYIKRPPRFMPDAEYASLAIHEEQTINFNNLRKKQWQFKYSYVYEDSQESVYSPISKLIAAQAEIDLLGNWNTDIITNNALKVTVNTGSNNVKKINVAVRDASNRNIGAFYKFITIDKFNSDNSSIINNDISYDVFFLNNTFLESIDDQYGNAYYHDVPLVAKDLILLDGKYAAMSMPKIGYDFNETDLDYTLGTVSTEVTFDFGFLVMNTVNETVGDSKLLKIYIPEKFYGLSTYVITYPCNGVVIRAEYTTPASEPAGYPVNVRDSLANELASYGLCINIPGYSLSLGTADNEIILADDVGFFQGLALPAFVQTAGFAIAYPSLKRGQYHSFAVVYNDEFGRYNVAFGNKKIFSPLHTSPDDLYSIINPRITISSIPPIWAKTYRIAYIPYNSYTYSSFVPSVEQIEGTGITTADDIPEGANGIPIGKYFLKINQAILRIITVYPDSRLEAYVWIDGDRMRRWGESDSQEILKEFTRIYTNDDDETTVETGFVVDEVFPVIPGTADPTIDLVGKVDILELYRPNLTPQDKIFSEITEDFEIIDWGTEDRRHSGNVFSQTVLPGLPSTAAVSDLDFGDIYYRIRLAGDIDAASVVPLVEDNNYNDYYTSDGINLGRGVVRTDSVQKTLKRVIKSENYLENTELNRLNIFLPGDENFPVSEVYGDITRIRERGDTLKIIQTHRETSSYIGKNYAKDAVGGDIILETDRVFGSKLPYESFIGAIYPRSVGVNDDYLYFMDTMTGDFMRSAVNGSISLPRQYGMEKYFDTKSIEFRASTESKDIIVSFEKRTSAVYLTFIIGNTIETIVFSEDDKNKGFIFFVEFINGSLVPEDFAWYGENMYSFVNGRIYLHNFGNVNEFYGSSRKESYVEFITNQYPGTQKLFETMSMDSDGQWAAEMTIEADNNYPSGQKTVILSSMFKNREGSLVSSIPGNILTRNGVEDIQRLYSGNKMLGHAMKAKVSSITLTRLREIKVTAINQK